MLKAVTKLYARRFSEAEKDFTEYRDFCSSPYVKYFLTLSRRLPRALAFCYELPSYHRAIVLGKPEAKERFMNKAEEMFTYVDSYETDALVSRPYSNSYKLKDELEHLSKHVGAMYYKLWTIELLAEAAEA